VGDAHPPTAGKNVVALLADETDRLAGETDEWRPGQVRQAEGYLIEVLSDGRLDLCWKTTGAWNRPAYRSGHTRQRSHRRVGLQRR
jgi:hypothetical protein